MHTLLYYVIAVDPKQFSNRQRSKIWFHYCFNTWALGIFASCEIDKNNVLSRQEY